MNRGLKQVGRGREPSGGAGTRERQRGQEERGHGVTAMSGQEEGAGVPTQRR